MSDRSPLSDPPSSGEQEPTMVSVPVVGSNNMASWNSTGADSDNLDASYLCHDSPANANDSNSASYLRNDPSGNANMCSGDSNSASYLHAGMVQDADSTSCDDGGMMVDDGLQSSMTVNAIVARESASQESEGSEDHLAVVDNITAQNFLRESDLMNAASSALGHKKSPSGDHDLEKSDLHHNLLSLEQHSVTSSQDHMEMESLLQEQQDLDGTTYHLDNSHESTSHLDMGQVGPGDGVCLSPSSNSSTSSLDLPVSISSGSIGLPPVSTIIRSSAKGRFDVFCRPSNINLIMGIPQYLGNNNSFDVMRLTSSPCDSLNVSLASPMEVSSSGHNDVMENVDVPMSSRCVKANSVMSSLGPDMMEKDSLGEMTDSQLGSEHGFHMPARTIPSFVGVVPLREIMHISTSPTQVPQHLSPTLEEMQKVAEISEHLRSGSPFTLHSADESLTRVMLSPHFSVGENIHHSGNYVECMSQRSQPSLVSAIETNVIMSTSNIDSSPKFTAAEIKAIEQRLRTEHTRNQNLEEANHSLEDAGLDSEVIIPDCIETTQNSDIIYSDVQDVLSRDSEERKILKAHNIARSTIIEKNLLQQHPQVVKKEQTVITSVENISLNKIITTKVSQNNNSDIITIKMAGKPRISESHHDSLPTVNPSAITASVIQQLLRVQSPTTKLRTTMQRIPRGVITSTMSSKGNPIVHQDILVPSSSPVNDLVSCKKDDMESGLSVPPNSILKETNLVDNAANSKNKPVTIDISEHSVISHGSKSPSSSDEKEVTLPNITTTVLPSLFSNLSASALASLQSSLSSALPLTIQSTLPNISICDNSATISHLSSVSPSLSSPPLSPILLPSILSSTLRNVSSSVACTLLDSIVTSNCVTSTNNMYSGLLKMSSVVKQEPGIVTGSGPLPPFTVVSGLSPLVKRGSLAQSLIGASPTSAQQIPVVTIKQEPGSSRASVSASEFNPSIILNAGTALPSIASIHLPSAAAVQLPVVVTSSSVATSTAALTNPVPSQASTIAFAGSVATSSADEPAKPSDKKWSCPMCKNGSPCGLHPGGGRAPPQPALSGDPAKPFQCTLCGKHLASKNVYQLHLRSHSGEKPFTCSLCGHHFSQKTSLTRHMRSHTGERPFPCEVCGKRFADKERIKIHMRTHTGEKPFACEVCGKRFSQKSTVKRHMSVHTGEKPFKCESCGKGFANRGNLNAHSKTHANT